MRDNPKGRHYTGLQNSPTCNVIRTTHVGPGHATSATRRHAESDMNKSSWQKPPAHTLRTGCDEKFVK